ncbi:MAG: hypothetical protein H6641_14950 [Caldilineaceae bacterium]|nr:hypothetical protein [Caldilineaceae bacterium]
MNTGHCRPRQNWKQIAVNALTIISSVITIGAAISIKIWADGIRISLELAQNKPPPTVIVLPPTPAPRPTFTATAAHTDTPMPLPTNTAEPTATPAPTLDLMAQKHIVRPDEIMACIAKLYYNYSDALDELCAYNLGHPDSALYGQQSCSAIFPGDAIIIPRSLFAVVVVDKFSKSKATRILNANEIEQPDNAYLCQNMP